VFLIWVNSLDSFIRISQISVKQFANCYVARGSNDFLDRGIRVFIAKNFVRLLIIQIKPFSKCGMNLTFATVSKTPEADRIASPIWLIDVSDIVSAIKTQLRSFTFACYNTLLIIKSYKIVYAECMQNARKKWELCGTGRNCTGQDGIFSCFKFL